MKTKISICRHHRDAVLIGALQAVAQVGVGTTSAQFNTGCTWVAFRLNYRAIYYQYHCCHNG